MGYIIFIGITLLISIPIVLLCGKNLSKYYESGQYEQDLKDGLYNDNKRQDLQ